MKKVTREQLEKMTAADRLELLTDGQREIATAMSGFADSCRRLTNALPLFVEACGPGRSWTMARW